ncbi:MAG: TonB-dependent receptor plug domain-containing protein [Bacteroidales bacterium]|nr:TonB-dependent receptor plug domain-containing protein [Bacteroidales bacterium]
MKGRLKDIGIAALTAAILFLAPAVASAQRVTVSGYMTDASSGESLISAALLEQLSGKGTVTNNYGFYTLTLNKGEVSLEYSYTGFEPFRTGFSLERDTVINIALKPAPEMLSGASVTASRSETGVRGTQMSTVEIPVRQILRVPALAGEVDVIKAIQLLPGVQSGTEGSAGLYVRGGGPDENLLLLDGVPIYNVNHMMGFFSVFNADAIKNVTLYKGSFPARFGSRLSSIVDVRMKDGNDQEFHGSASVGLLSAKFNLEGPIVKGRTTFNVSARRTYYDILAQPVFMYINRDSQDRGMGGYYFYDINAKLTHRFSNRDKLYVSYYMGDDQVYARVKMNAEREKDNMKLGWYWGNIVGSVRWNHLFGSRLFVNTTLNYTQYRHKLDADVKHYELQNDPASAFSLGYNSLINDISASSDFEFNPSPRHDVRFGATFIRHTFKPSVNTVHYEDRTGGMEMVQDTTFGDRNLYTAEGAAYVEDNWTAFEWLKINGGLRISLYSTGKSNYFSLEPRLGLRLLFSEHFSMKASYSEMSQSVHMLSNSNISMPTDLWVPSTDRIRPMRARQAAAGLFYELGPVDFSLEGYWKGMDNLLEYRDGATFLGSSSGWEDKVASGRGWAYGIEFLVQKKSGRFTGWVGYTWSRTMRLFDREGNVINFGRPFPAKYDRRHDLSIVASYEFSKKFDLSATFVYGTGLCGSLALQTISVPPGYNFDAGSFTNPYPVDYLESRNNYRLPSYQRLDIGFNFHREFRSGRHRTINLSVYNVYNRNNPFLVYRVGSSLKQLSIFPIMPSLSYTFYF